MKDWDIYVPACLIPALSLPFTGNQLSCSSSVSLRFVNIARVLYISRLVKLYQLKLNLFLIY